MAESSSRLARAPSVSSAGTASTSGAHGVIPRYTPKPEPAYISATSAADHITHRHHHENIDPLSPAPTPTNDGAEFSVSSLALLNSFLDSLLYNFLSKARSVELPRLRLAILEVLKAKLGREALASADEELEGLIGDVDDEDSASGSPTKDHPKRSSTPSLDWHLESAFKRMRLRVMVFIRLGDFDDDDEEKFLDDDASGPSPALDHTILSSPAAVYLASVLEYLAEQTLSLVGDAAYSRSKSKARRGLRRESLTVRTYDADSVVVEDVDIEKIALNPSLGRLWRTWRKTQRSVMVPSSPSGDARRSSMTSPPPTRSAEEIRRRSELRKSGSFLVMQTVDAAQEDSQEEDTIPDCEPSETDIAANIPLPVSVRDVDEIEIPGLAAVVYDEDEEHSDDDETEWQQVTRPRSESFSVPGAFVEDKPLKSIIITRPNFTRQRSSSVPHAASVPWDWLPASVRRALAKLAAMDDVELAAITPLPEDDEKVFFDANESDDAETVASADVDPSDPVDDESLVDEAGASHPSIVETEKLQAPDAGAIDKPSVDEVQDEVVVNGAPLETNNEAVETSQSDTFTEGSKESQKSQDGDKSNAGIIAGASALITAAAAALVAAGSSGKPTSTKPEKDSQDAEDLSVQTKEVFEDDDDSDRPTDFVPKSILKPARPPPAPRTTERKISSDNVKKMVRTKPEAIVPKRQTDEALEDSTKDVSAVSVYAPTKTTKENVVPIMTTPEPQDTTNAARVKSTTINKVNQDSLASDSNAVDEPAPVSASLQESTKESKLESLSPVDVRKSTETVTSSGIDSKMSSPMHTKSSGQASAQATKTEITTPATVTSDRLSESFPETQEAGVSTIGRAKTASKEEVTAAVADSAKEGPPKPLTSTGPHPVNPYAMLYEDIEPEAIGIAKTSNVPIHSITPSVSVDARPWTPNRGALRTSASKENVNGEQRSRNVPSPLRVDEEPKPLEQAPQVTPKKAVSTEEYDLDKPIDPGRFQTWSRPKESPTIPKFYNSVSTPTKTEAQRSGSISHQSSDHSPKGSQSSHKSNKRASEELKEREFDALLDRKETVKYTLTPEEIRDVGPYSPKTATGERNTPAPIDTASKTIVPAAPLSPTLLRKTPPATTTVHVQPPTTVPVVVAPVSPPKPQVQTKQPPSMRPLKISEIRKSISALSPEPVEPRKRRSGLMAREARVLGGDTKDFVDFIRSCAPTSEDQIQPAVLANRWSAGPSMGNARPAKSNMVPRDPDIRNGPSGDLIEFIRDGPPGGSNGLVSPIQKDKPLPTPKTQATPAVPPQVTRKVHRNKDPYAIDYDDDDDDDLTALPISDSRITGVPKSENLQDFLRSTSPGPSRLNGIANGISSPNQNGTTGQRSASAASVRPTQPSALQNSLAGSTNQSASAYNSLSSREPSKASGGFFARKKYEARPAGATRGFGGHGFHYSTSDLADYLRSSGPNGATRNAKASNQADTGKDNYNGGDMSGRNTPTGSIGVKRGDSTRRRIFGRKVEA